MYFVYKTERILCWGDVVKTWRLWIMVTDSVLFTHLVPPSLSD